MEDKAEPNNTETKERTPHGQKNLSWRTLVKSSSNSKANHPGGPSRDVGYVQWALVKGPQLGISLYVS